MLKFLVWCGSGGTQPSSLFMGSAALDMESRLCLRQCVLACGGCVRVPFFCFQTSVLSLWYNLLFGVFTFLCWNKKPAPVDTGSPWLKNIPLPKTCLKRSMCHLAKSHHSGEKFHVLSNFSPFILLSIIMKVIFSDFYKPLEKAIKLIPFIVFERTLYKIDHFVVLFIPIL